MPLGTTIDAETIAAAKARYADLKSAGQSEEALEQRLAAAPPLPDLIPADLVRLGDTIPGGWYFTGRLTAGEVLRLENPGGTEGVSVYFWSAADPTERLNPPDTIKVQWTANLGKGRVLLSDMGRAIASIVDAIDAPIDAISGPSTAASNREKYGDATLFSSRDHLIKAAGKFGLSKRDLGPVLTVFAPVDVDATGAVMWGAKPFAGRIDLRVEMDVLAVVTNCPHPLAPSEVYAPKPVPLTLWRAGTAGADDLCRTATPEAVRAFENNAAL